LDALNGLGERPLLERRAIAQGAGLDLQCRQIMPGRVHDLIAPEAAAMFGNHPPVGPDHHAVGVRPHRDDLTDVTALDAAAMSA
jgi:hypothetical protein